MHFFIHLFVQIKQNIIAFDFTCDSDKFVLSNLNSHIPMQQYEFAGYPFVSAFGFIRAARCSWNFVRSR